MKQLTPEQIATIVSNAVAVSLAQILGTSEPLETTKNKPNSTGTRTNKKAESEETTDDKNVIEILVSETATDPRFKLPARMMNKSGYVVINGTKYYGVETDKMRCKVQPKEFGAERGDTIRFERKFADKWDAVVLGQPKANNKPGKTQEKIAQNDKPNSNKGQTQKPTAKDTEMDTVENRTFTTKKAFIAHYAKLALAGYKLVQSGQRKPLEKLVDFGLGDDARVFLSSRENKAFKENRKALELDMKDAILALNEEVYN